MFHATGTTFTTRRVAPSHQAWAPHDYQERAVRFLCGLEDDGLPAGANASPGMAAALFLDPGLGKTSIVLEAFRRLKLAGKAKRMLVVAPLRVCQLVWPAEGRKWTQFRDLKITFLHGDKKDRLLKQESDIFLINPEGMDWLSGRFFGQTFPFDIVCIDELTKFKNSQAKRHKKLRPRLKNVPRRWGLTGTPAPNGYMDLFGQFLVLDDGAALGSYITHFRDKYFVLSFNGFDYNLQAGAAQKIEDKIAPYVLRMSAADYLDLPPLLEDRRFIDMDPKSRKLYDEMAKETIIALEGRVVTGANAGAVYSKLKQMANGAVYVGDGDTRETLKIHDTKLDALEELVDELAGQPLLVAYEFNHDLERLLERFPGTPYLGRGIGEAATRKAEEDWNAGKLRLMFVHPQSAGHGLNLQQGGASHICWFSPIWDLELWDQLIRRLLRQGTTAQHVINHILIVRGTLDEEALTAIEDKDTTQSRLLDRLNAILHSAETLESRDMAGFKKLGKQSEAGAGSAPAEDAPRAGGGWGRGSAGGREEPAAGDEAGAQTQKERIAEKVSAPPPREETEQPATEPKGKAAAPTQEQPEEPPPREAAKSLFSKVLETEGTVEGEQATTSAGAEGAGATTQSGGWGKPSVPRAEAAETPVKPAAAPRTRKATTAAPAAQAEPAPAPAATSQTAVDMVGHNGSAKFELDENGVANLELRLNLRLPLAQLGDILAALGKVLPGAPPF